MNGLLVRALLAFLALPGTVAFLIPLLILAPRTDASISPLGLVPLALGTALLLWCVREFYVAGRGTLAPWSPPQHLVVSGLYRFSRNPMYVAVLLILWGWTLAFRSMPLAIYAIAINLLFHLRVVLYEEPWLERTFAGTWARYRVRVPRWIGIGRVLGGTM